MITSRNVAMVSYSNMRLSRRARRTSDAAMESDSAQLGIRRAL